MTLEAVLDHVDHFQRRVVQDAVTEATAGYWVTRAAAFEWARPRPDDYTGRATREQVAELDDRCAEAAEACRARAAASLIGGTA